MNADDAAKPKEGATGTRARTRKRRDGDGTSLR